MFYKIIKDQMIVDVNNVFLHENPKNHVLTDTTYEHAHFIASSDKQKLYKTHWCGGIENSAYHVELVQAEFIDEAEYNSLKQQLETADVQYIEVKNQEEPVIVEPKEDVRVLDNIEMKRRILELEELVRQLLQK